MLTVLLDRKVTLAGMEGLGIQVREEFQESQEMTVSPDDQELKVVLDHRAYVARREKRVRCSVTVKFFIIFFSVMKFQCSAACCANHLLDFVRRIVYCLVCSEHLSERV